MAELQHARSLRTGNHRELRYVPAPGRADFLQPPPPTVQALSEITSAVSYPKGVTLFVEGQKAGLVFILSRDAETFDVLG